MTATLRHHSEVPQHRDRQPLASTGKQGEMPWLGETKKPSLVEPFLVESCKDELMALNRCIDLSSLTDEYLSGALGIDKGHWSRIRKGRAHFPARKRLKLMELAGNLLPLQYEAWRMGFDLDVIDPNKRRIRELERELAKERARAA
jgi:hypothetical protein